jgi:hypothetical protein
MVIFGAGSSQVELQVRGRVNLQLTRPKTAKPVEIQCHLRACSSASSQPSNNCLVLIYALIFAKSVIRGQLKGEYEENQADIFGYRRPSNTSPYEI